LSFAENANIKRIINITSINLLFMRILQIQHIKEICEMLGKHSKDNLVTQAGIQSDQKDINKQSHGIESEEL
jgi:hypothetical protein